jgi:ubiquinone/menaquinone biosynthesis C-methylase UbiE
MRRLTLFALLIVTVAAASPFAQQPDAAQIKQERARAELEAPYLVEVLGLKPGMTVADIGSGGGAFTVVLGHWIGSGKVLATDVTDHALRETREYAAKEGLKNVTVIEGNATSTNLPANCCDAIFMRDVYHHITQVDAFTKSLFATLKPGSRLAILDFIPQPGSKLPAGVPENRGGHGIPIAVVENELKAAGFTHLRSVERWPQGNAKEDLFLVLFEKPQ